MSLFTRLGALLVGGDVRPNYPICSEVRSCGCCSDGRLRVCDVRYGDDCGCVNIRC